MKSERDDKLQTKYIDSASFWLQWVILNGYFEFVVFSPTIRESWGLTWHGVSLRPISLFLFDRFKLSQISSLTFHVPVLDMASQKSLFHQMFSFPAIGQIEQVVGTQTACF